MESSEAESRGRFKVSVAPPPPETSVGRFRLIPQGSPFLQRGRFSVIPEEETGSPLTQVKLSGPKIIVDASPEWDFVSKTIYANYLDISSAEIARFVCFSTETFIVILHWLWNEEIVMKNERIQSFWSFRGEWSEIFLNSSLINR